jgi:galactose mutarotase-like enzyme
MDQGYPGLVEFKVIYTLTYPGSLSIDFLAILVSDAKSTYVIIDID